MKRSILLQLLALTLTYGQQFGDFTYSVIDDTVEITAYTGSETGRLVIPSEIAGYAVTTLGFAALNTSLFSEVTIPDSITTIGESAFQQCSALLSLHIPNSVTSIGDNAFLNCSSIETIAFGTGLTEIGFSVFNNCSSLTALDLPSGITSIGAFAFADCESLESVLIPASVDSIGNGAFTSCASLSSALFLGDAPTTFDFSSNPFIRDDAFAGSDTDFTLYHTSTSSGFTSTAWTSEYSNLTELDTIALPPAPWLLAYGIPLNVDFSTSLNDKGVTLFTAYAFHLHPFTPTTNQISDCLEIEGSLGLGFYGGRDGITYVGETSTNMETWTTSGVTLTPPDSTGYQTVTTPKSGSRSFLRFTATQNW